jgi:hypothetical protein
LVFLFPRAGAIPIPRIAAIGMLSLYLPQSFWTVLAEGYDVGAVTNIVSARAFHIGGVLALKLERKEVHGTS